MSKTPIILLVSRDPITYQVDVEALTDLLISNQEDIGETLLEVIAQADEQFYAWICCGLQQTDADDELSIQIENFGIPSLGMLIMSRAMLSTKKFAIFLQYNASGEDFEIEFNMSNPEAAPKEFRQRLDSVKGLREATTFEELVRVTA